MQVLRPSLRRVRLPNMSWSTWLPTIMPIWRRLPFAMKNSPTATLESPHLSGEWGPPEATGGDQNWGGG
jgi:hypothetical protein